MFVLEKYAFYEFAADCCNQEFQRVEKRENEVILSFSASYLCDILTAGQGEAMIGQSVCCLFERAQFSLQDVLKAFALCV